MEATLTPTPITTNVSLASSALLVSIEVNMWTATKQDRAISNEVTTQKNATADSAKVTKLLLSHSPHHKALLNYRQTIYNWLQRITFDWAGKIRLLPTFRIEQFNREFAAHEVEFNKLLEAFIKEYPSLVSDAAFKHGDMFDRSEYPEAQDVLSRFRLEKFVTVLPKDDFRVAVADAIADDLRSQYNEQMKQITAGVGEDMRQQLVLYATRLRNACEEVQAEANEEAKSGKVKRRKIYESTFDNVRSMVDLIRNFNVTGDADLRDAADKLDEILKAHTLDALRESAFSRNDAREDLDDILSKFAPINTFTANEDGDDNN